MELMPRVEKDTLRNFEIRRGADIQEFMTRGIRESRNSGAVKIRKCGTHEFNNPCSQEFRKAEDHEVRIQGMQELTKQH